MNTSQTLASTMLAAGAARYNGATLTFYSGAMPPSPETALSGNTAIAIFTFAPTAFGAPTFTAPNAGIVALFAGTTQPPLAAGTISFARAVASDGVSALADYTVGATGSGADITIANPTVTLGVPVSLNSFTQMLPAV